ncbi:hypothetical protein RB16p092 [Escherichia phage RB16]|uniref:Conserved hypothetical phage protein n=1 Tax=Escherichia phage RB16 TaxID=2681599 RepID=D9ICF3_BPRB1|nr:hypothetical protein RB16p092 [Escherichia phage RB16]ADJ55396.1 conserved hypothetical phage protein [Escherichia phage RB16]WOL25252.1 hypothetical protein iPHageKPN12i_00185 [Klebsiella phage iPHaGe-KPN-12i]
MKNEPSKTVRLIRWEGNELRYEDGDREFVHEMLAHNLGFKNAALVMMQQTSDEDTWQCVILDLDKNKEYTEDELFALTENATARQKCFMIDMPRENYENIKKARKQNKNNVFDLFMGYHEETTA